MPRFSTTGKPERPAARSSGVFCIDRVPISRASTRPAIRSTCSSESGSTSTGRPVSARADSTRARPASPIPWKASGRVRGLKMLPRRMEAPASRMATAWLTYSGSTAQGPAMTGTAGPPKTTSPTVTRRRAGDDLVGLSRSVSIGASCVLLRTGLRLALIRAGPSAARISARVYLLGQRPAPAGGRCGVLKVKVEARRDREHWVGSYQDPGAWQAQDQLPLDKLMTGSCPGTRWSRQCHQPHRGEDPRTDRQHREAPPRAPHRQHRRAEQQRKCPDQDPARVLTQERSREDGASTGRPGKSEAQPAAPG